MAIRTIMSIATAVWPMLGRRLKLMLGAWFLVPVLMILVVMGLVIAGAFWMARQSPGPQANGFDVDADPDDFDDAAAEPV